MSAEAVSDWPIFIISLADACSRRQPLVDALNQINLSFTVFDAIDGRNGLPKDFSSLIDREKAKLNLGRPMTDAEFACAISHHLIYKKLLSDGYRGALILEDDAQPNPLFQQAWTSAFFKRYDFVQWNYGFCRAWRGPFARKREAADLVSARLVSNSGLASAYSISRKAANFLIDSSLPIALPADWPCDLRPLSPRIVFPRPITAPLHDSAQSHLERGRKREKKKHVKQKRVGESVKQTAAPRVKRNPLPSYPSFIYRLLAQSIPSK